MDYEIGDLVRCWQIACTEHGRVVFSIGIIISVDELYAKVCLQDTGEVLRINKRSIYLIKRNKKFIDEKKTT